MHSSSVPAARLPRVRVSLATTGCQYWWGMGIGPQMNKFEQVSSDDHQISVAREWRSTRVSFGGWGGYPGLRSEKEGVRYHVTYAMMHVM